MPGAKADFGSRHKKGEQDEGIKGLKALGVRDLNYRMAFLACSIAHMSTTVSLTFSLLFLPPAFKIFCCFKLFFQLNLRK